MPQDNLPETIFNRLQAYVSRFGVDRVKKVVLRIGPERGIQRTALTSEMRTISFNTALQETEWIIEDMTVSARCNSCGKVFEITPSPKVNCPGCGGDDVDIHSAKPFEIIGIEI